MSARARRIALRELLDGGSGRVSTQSELCALLAAEGYEVTQSTISRDLKRLGAERTFGTDGTPVYRLGPAPRPGLSAGIVLSVSHNEQLVVVRTRAGLAQAVGVDIDALGRPDVLGTVAGDDTVLVIPRSITEVAALTAALRGLSGIA